MPCESCLLIKEALLPVEVERLLQCGYDNRLDFFITENNRKNILPKARRDILKLCNDQQWTWQQVHESAEELQSPLKSTSRRYSRYLDNIEMTHIERIIQHFEGAYFRHKRMHVAFLYSDTNCKMQGIRNFLSFQYII